MKKAKITGLFICAAAIFAGMAAWYFLFWQSDTVDGTEKTYYGIVVDQAMDEGREYIGVEYDEGGGECFYYARGIKYSFPEGSLLDKRVKIETATEVHTGNLIATHIEVLE